jgi:hypothetical protein
MFRRSTIVEQVRDRWRRLSVVTECKRNPIDLFRMFCAQPLLNRSIEFVRSLLEVQSNKLTSSEMNFENRQSVKLYSINIERLQHIN